ncbi:MAG: 1-acyl-sn-glycerol-3-phosphate acyltransferase, partial [Candidatus Cryptobacteroides sp.]
SAGKPPYTFWSIVRDIYYYVPVMTGGILLLLFGIVLQAVPMNRDRRRSIIAAGMHKCCRLMLGIMPFIHFRKYGPDGGEMEVWNGAPGVVVANHQSSLDVFVLAALFPKVKFLVADWVVKSPLFSLITRMLGYYSKADGYEAVKDSLKSDIDNGWCIAIFPEGTRSPDGKIRRFHKGAFYMASELDVPLIPVAIYGNRRIMPKNDGFNMMEGLSVARVLSPVDAGRFEYHELTRMVEGLVRDAANELAKRYDSPENPYFRKALESAYIYKGPVIEWYVKVKTRLEEDYSVYNELVPESGTITDIGCGMGQMAYMLSMYRPGRRIIGVDYDKTKIEIAGNCWMKKNLPGLEFKAADAMEVEFPGSNVFIISDMLHYLPEEQQFALLEKCRSRLIPGGVILIREGNSSDKKGQKMTVLSELLSTKVLGFNKTSGRLEFTSAAKLKDYAARLGLKFSEVRKNKLSANTLYLLKSE